MKFIKMQATGNDFVLVDARRMRRQWGELAKVMCDRHFGVGADGLLLVLNSKEADFAMRIFNPDGSEAEMCGNGIRCFAKYVVESGIYTKRRRELAIDTVAGIRQVRPVKRGARVVAAQVNMGEPRLRSSEIPVTIIDTERRMLFDVILVADQPVPLDGRDVLVTCVSMGNPHAVTFLDPRDEPVDSYPLKEIGPRVENHAMFPQRTNFEVANVIDSGHIRARVWERGVGETLSCGTGACAVGVAARLHDRVGDDVDITLHGGTLTITWKGEGDVWLTGPVEEVFTGEWRE